jgi:hypothetical protein
VERQKSIPDDPVLHQPQLLCAVQLAHPSLAKAKHGSQS